MRLFTSLLLFVAGVLGDIEFVSPGPSVSNSNPSVSNAVHPNGSNFHVAWSGTNTSRAVSVVLFQYDGVDLVYPFEYVLQSAVDETSSDWTVTTDKNLSFSNLFLFNLFYEGETSPVAVSETFNITGDSSSSTTTSSASTTSSATAISTNFLTSTISVAATSHTGSATSSTTTAAAASTTGTVSSQSGGLSTGTKIGVGIAVPAVAFIGIAVGYFLFRHRAKKQQYAATPHAAEQSPGPMEQKPDDLTVGYTHERPAYELYSVSGSPMPMNQRPAYPTAGYTPERPTYELDNMSGPMTRYELGSDTGRH